MASTKAAVEFWKAMTGTKTFDSVLSKVKILSAEGGKCIAEMKVDEEHTNRVGMLHGGYTATLADMLTTLALYTTKDKTLGVSVNLNMSYLKAARIGQDIVIEANISKLGKRLAFVNFIIKQKDTGDIVATGSHTEYIY